MNSISFKKLELSLILSIFLVCFRQGCQTIQPSKTPMEMASETIVTPEPKLILGSGDTLDIKFFNNPELNENQAIRPDGKISLQLIGEVMANGKSPEELKEHLVKLYTPQLRKPDVTVIVRTLANRRVYVGGHVKTPGLLELRPQMTALEAIIQAGGVDC